MKNFCTNQYLSLNIFNYVIIISFVATLFHFYTNFSAFVIILYTIVIGTILLLRYFTVDKKQKINIKNNIFQKSITSLAILFYSLIIAFVLYLFFSYTSLHHTYTNPNKYTQAIKAIKNKSEISHFPQGIPKKANDIQFLCYTSDFNGEIMILKFKINKDYIEQELKNHKFINSNTPIGTLQNIYYIYTDNNRIKIDNTTWYVIDNEKNRQIYPKYFPYYSSIGVGNDMNYIIYYYIEPSD